MDTPRRVPLCKLSLLQPRMHLYLVHSRRDLPLLKNPLDFSLVEVAHPNRLHLARLDQLLHRLPRIEVVDIRRLHLSICIFWHELSTGFERSGPMHQVEIDVVGLQGFEGIIEGWLDILGSMGVIPELGGDKDALSVYSGFFDSFCNCRLRAIDVCSINVAVL